VVGPGSRPRVVTPWNEAAFATVLGGQTGGAFTLIDVVAGPGWVRPVYVHHAADECFYVVEGAIEVFLDDPDRVVRVAAGSSVYVPRGVGRSLRLLPPGSGRLLLISTPATPEDDGTPTAGIEFVGGPTARPAPADPEESR